MKQQVVSFKVDQSLHGLLEHIPNKSEFIRQAIMQALEATCPLCNGTGILNPAQQKHWEEFSRHHRLVRCDECNEVHLECEADQHKAGKGHDKR